MHVELVLSGGVAQYGRSVGLIQVTAAKMMNQFANNCERRWLGTEHRSNPRSDAAWMDGRSEPEPLTASDQSVKMLPSRGIHLRHDARSAPFRRR